MLKEFSQKFLQNEDKILEWLKNHTEKVQGPIYSSVDVRNAGYKIAPVDTNLFPGGFNNLCKNYQHKAGELMHDYISKFHPGTKKIIIIGESHTRNQYYFSNLLKIQQFLEEQNFAVRIGSLNPELNKHHSTKFKTAENEDITIYPLSRIDDHLVCLDFKADFYLLNNDFSEGLPDLLKNLSIPIVPTPAIGWHNRTKSRHFEIYNDLIEEFAKIVDMDPWLFTTEMDTMDDIDFESQNSLKKLATKVDSLIKKIDQKYKNHNVNEKPYVFIKNNSGTYGIGVTNVYSGEEILQSNRKTKNKMSTGKGNTRITSVIIQEGIPTIDRFNNHIAEPVLYLVNNQVAGGFFRLNTEQDAYSNLNSKGMQFTKLCFHELEGYSNVYHGECNLSCLEKIYKTISQIASIAAGYEIKQLNEE